MYDKILTYRYIQNSTQRLPLDSIEYRCRFCGEVKTKNEFRQKAHAVAEGIGNKALITKYECDACNDRFAKAEESELGKLLHEFKATHSLKGKSGTTKIHGADYSWSEETGTFSANINMREADYDIAVLNILDKDTAELLIRRTKEVNFRLVYGALVKFALSVVPEAISKELGKGYAILHERKTFPNYSGLLVVSTKLITDPQISIYESDDPTEAKYLATIDAFEFRYIIPLDFERVIVPLRPDIVLSLDFSNVDGCEVRPFDYSDDSAKLQQITHVTGKLNNWSITDRKNISEE